MSVEIDVTNRQLVSIHNGKIVIMIPLPYMSKQEALVHAAWLVALADDKNEFGEVLKAVQNT